MKPKKSSKRVVHLKTCALSPRFILSYVAVLFLFSILVLPLSLSSLVAVLFGDRCKAIHHDAAVRRDCRCKRERRFDCSSIGMRPKITRRVRSRRIDPHGFEASSIAGSIHRIREIVDKDESKVAARQQLAPFDARDDTTHIAHVSILFWVGNGGALPLSLFLTIPHTPQHRRYHSESAKRRTTRRPYQTLVPEHAAVLPGGHFS